MTYNQLIKIVRQGNLGKLPNFEGYFKWDYAIDDLIFYNGNYSCRAKDLNVQDREDFYYII